MLSIHDADVKDLDTEMYYPIKQIGLNEKWNAIF